MIIPSVKTLSILIKNNSSTIVSYILKASLFKGAWYLRRKPFNFNDKPKYLDYTSDEALDLIQDIKYLSFIKKKKTYLCFWQK